MIEAIRKAENITATEEETDAEIQQYADQNKKTLDEFKKMISEDDMEYFANAAATRKTFDFLKANAE